MSINDTSCCGTRELDGVSNEPPEALIREMIEDEFQTSHYDFGARKLEKRWNPVFAFVIFSDTNAKTYGSRRPRQYSGEKFAAYLKTHKLGTVTASVKRTNPNHTGRRGVFLRVWVWAMDFKALKAWAKDHMTQEDEGDETWHNFSGKTGETRPPRCTFCGTPVKTGFQREHWEIVKRQQVVKQP